MTADYTSTQVTDTPVTRAERYLTLDVLRGFAVLAIFAVNIKGMFTPFAYYGNASLWSGPYDMLVASFQVFLIDDKWRTIFTGLFGAGIVLMAEKSALKDQNPLGRLTRRNLLLLGFGLVHLILIWTGDILTVYALTGFVAMLFWNKSVKSLWLWAIALFILAWVWSGFMTLSMTYSPEVRSEVKPIMWLPDPEYLQETMDIFLSSNIGEHITVRAQDAFGMIVFFFLLGGFFPTLLAIMVSGMALWKNGFLKGNYSTKTYLKIAFTGLAIALITDTGRWVALLHSGFSYEVFMVSQFSNFFNGLAGGIGYAALILAVLKSGAKFTPVAMAGRMAFTNYILCSLIGTTLAYGHGFSMFGTLTNLELMGIVFIVWAVLLAFSTVWLSIFRFGPLEWLWRSLTYQKLQPII